jgi:hypothetical protein
MSEQTSPTTVAETKPKKTPEELAKENGLKIFLSGRNAGKIDAKGESKDPRRKKLARSVDTVTKARENGKNKTFKNIKVAFNALDDDRESFSKAKLLFETTMNYFDQLEIPAPKPKPQPEQKFV